MSKFADKVLDKLLESVAGLLATFLVSLLAGIGALVIAYTSANPIPTLVWVIVVLSLVNMVLVARFFLKRHTQWNKSGNLWWLCRDLYAARAWIGDPNSTKRQIDHGLLKCYHHAAQLELGDDIVGRLQRLKEEAQQYSLSDWTPARRQDFRQALYSIREDIGQIAQRNQADFDAGPSLI